jgi:hypothetical protein
MPLRGMIRTMVAMSVVAGATVPLGAQTDGPSQAIVAALLVQKYEPGGNKPDGHLDVTMVQLGAGHRASAHEGMWLQVSLGQMIYPVRVRYTLVSGTGPSAYVRDWDTHYYVFRSAQMGGRWDLTENTQPGDIVSVLRGG